MAKIISPIPKLAIFDMDGILFNTEKLFMDKKNIVLEQYGYPARKEDYVRTLGAKGDTLNKILTDIYGIDYPAEEITNLTRTKVNDHITQYGLEIKPGIPELLEFLSTHKTLCMVASSTRYETVNKYLEMSNLKKYFSVIIGGDMVKKSKPDPEIFITAFQRHTDYIEQLTPAQAIVFEDSENGILAAHAANLPVICIPDLKHPEDKIAQLTVKILPSAHKVIDYYTCSSQDLI